MAHENNYRQDAGEDQEVKMHGTVELDLKHFAERANRYDQTGDWPTEDLAELAELHRNYVSQIEVGRRNVSLLNILKLARGLKVRAAKLIDAIR